MPPIILYLDHSATAALSWDRTRHFGLTKRKRYLYRHSEPQASDKDSTTDGIPSPIYQTTSKEEFEPIYLTYIRPSIRWLVSSPTPWTPASRS
ncbi:hypothetical protein TNCV_4260321 [Trichonephila clavipes]|nr:hypothetical protein TNCV_4260321 [Trichonephila clavipes]